MIIAYVALIIRIVLLGLERIVVKLVGDQEGDLLKNTAATVVFFGLGAILLLPVILVTGIKINQTIAYCFFNSIIYSVSFVLYVASLAQGEASLVTPLNSTNILFLMLFSSFFLGEPLTIFKILGTLIMLLGVSLLKRQNNVIQSIKQITKDKPCVYMLISAAFLAIGRIIDKSYIKDLDSITYTFFLYIFVAANLSLILAIKGKFHYVKEIIVSKPVFSFLSGAINAYSYLALLVALKTIQVSIAEPLAQTSMIITILISFFVLKEEIKSKLPGVILIFIASCLLVINI